MIVCIVAIFYNQPIVSLAKQTGDGLYLVMCNSVIVLIKDLHCVGVWCEWQAFTAGVLLFFCCMSVLKKNLWFQSVCAKA